MFQDSPQVQPGPAPHPLDLNALGALAPLLVSLVGQRRLRIIREQARPLIEHLADYAIAVRSRGKTEHYTTTTLRLARVMVRLCRARTYDELRPQVIRQAVLKLRAAHPRPRRRKGLGLAACNHYLKSLRAFCNWMVGDDRAEISPCAGVPLFNAKLDPRHPRRPFTVDEAARLVKAATEGKTLNRCRITGPERAIMYLVAMTTGLRARELQSLGKRSFRIEGDADPHLVVEAWEAKGRKRAVLPIRADVAAKLRDYLANTDRAEKLLRRSSKGIREFREDLHNAGIAYVDAEGRYADFHALRHTFITGLVGSGATIKEAQTLARHSDVRITMEYSHSTTLADRAAVERLGAAQAVSALAAPPRVTPLEAARLASVDRRVIDRAVAAGKIPAKGAARHWLLDRAAVEKFIAERNRPGLMMADAARLAGVKGGTIELAIRKGQLKADGPSGERRIDRASLSMWIEWRRQKAARRERRGIMQPIG